MLSGKGRGIGKCRGGAEEEPEPRRALVARLGFLAGRETAKEPRRALQALVWGWLR